MISLNLKFLSTLKYYPKPLFYFQSSQCKKMYIDLTFLSVTAAQCYCLQKSTFTGRKHLPLSYPWTDKKDKDWRKKRKIQSDQHYTLSWETQSALCTAIINIPYMCVFGFCCKFSVSEQVYCNTKTSSLFWSVKKKCAP